MTNFSQRAGAFINQPAGYRSFVPKKLPPDPPIQFDDEMMSLLSRADRELGRLDGITQILPNPDLFLAMYVKKEALLSSQIEGTQASLIDVLVVNQKQERPNQNVADVTNYVKAMDYGLLRLKELPLSLRLIREIHAILLETGRGSAKNPGEFRRSQNWIGYAGCTLSTATFVPPSLPDMDQALGDLENFIHADDTIPALIKIALIHAQFETIHPFLDGNGRMGRLLITFWLCVQNILSKPLLYLSYYFKLNRTEYYDRLMNVRKNGDWENWVKFFLRGIAFTSQESIQSAKQIIQLKESGSHKLYKLKPGNNSCQRLFDLLFMNPIVTKTFVRDELPVSYPTAGALVDDFCKVGILHDCQPSKSRGKEYAFVDYINILEKGTEEILN